VPITAYSMGLVSTTLTQLVLKYDSYNTIMHINAIRLQGHSRSPILAPTESSYATSY